MKSITQHVLVLLIGLLPGIYLVSIYNSLPEGNVIAMHFNLRMEADRFGNKNELLILTAIMFAVSMFVYLLMMNIYRIDPKQRGVPPSTMFKRLALVIVIFLSLLTILIINASLGKPAELLKMIFPLMGLMFAFVGNYMYTIKPNYFAGIRLPWTLSDDNNWRRTHHLASKLWFWGGLSAAAISFIYPSEMTRIIFIVILIVITIIPMVYSYRIFKETKPDQI